MVEAVTVTSIIAVLVGLLLPAIQQAREVACKVHCTNNLKQLGIAMWNYESSHQTFPGDLSIVSTESDDVVVSYATQFVLMFPYLDQTGVYSSYDFDKPWFMQPGSLAATPVTVLNCPSSSHDNPTDVTLYQTALESLGGVAFDVGRVGTTDYILSKGANGSLGMFDVCRTTRPCEITDGTSNTIAIGEGSGGSSWKVCQGVGCTTPADGGLSLQSWIIASINTQQYVEQGLFPLSTSIYGSTVDRLNKNPVTATVFNDVPTMNNQGGNTRAGFPPGIMTTSNFRSDHVGGANFLFADGSVRFKSDRMAKAAYQALSTIRGAEVQSSQ